MSLTGTVLSTSAAFNCLLSTCGAIYAPFERTFAFCASGLWTLKLRSEIALPETKEVRHFLPSVHAGHALCFSNREGGDAERLSGKTSNTETKSPERQKQAGEKLVSLLS